jgi:outer membrane beta-barrel protein
MMNRGLTMRMSRGARGAARFLALVVALLVLCVAQQAVAQSRSLFEGPVVRRQLLFRSSKLEVSPALGMALGGVYQREVMVGLTGRYHLTNSFAAGLNVHVSPIALNSSLVDNLATTSPEVARQMAYATQTALLDAHLSYVPMGGKFHLFNGRTYYYDFSLTAGVGGALLSSDSDELAGFRFGPALGAGMRIFVTDNIALNFRATSYLYSSALSQRIERTSTGLPSPQPIEERFRANTIGLIGVSIFLPPDVRVSR